MLSLNWRINMKKTRNRKKMNFKNIYLMLFALITIFFIIFLRIINIIPTLYFIILCLSTLLCKKFKKSRPGAKQIKSLFKDASLKRVYIFKEIQRENKERLIKILPLSLFSIYIISYFFNFVNKNFPYGEKRTVALSRQSVPQAMR